MIPLPTVASFTTTLSACFLCLTAVLIGARRICQQKSGRPDSAPGLVLCNQETQEEKNTCTTNANENPIDLLNDSEFSIHQRFPWSLYEAVPPIYQKHVEAVALRAVVGHLQSKNMDQRDLSFDDCVEILQNDRGFRLLFLCCWRTGSFEELGPHVTLQRALRHVHDPNENGGHFRQDRLIEESIRETQDGQGGSGTEDFRTKQDAQHHSRGEGKPAKKADCVTVCEQEIYLSQDSGSESDRLFEWLSDLDHHTIHIEISRRRVKDTGNWFLATDDFCRWRKDPVRRILWCPGIPGVGKTFIASRVIDHLKEAEDPVFFFYFSYRTQNQQNVPSLLRSLSRQAHEACRLTNVKSSFEAMYAFHRKNGSAPSEDDLQFALSDAISQFKCCYIVVDALDECLEEYDCAYSRKLLETLLSLGSGVKLLVTSRILGNMEDVFSELGAIKEPIIAHDQDITTYLQVRIASAGYQFELPKTLNAEIIDKVQAAAKGRFLMAELHMNALKKYLNPGDLQDALDNLPEEVDETYARIMKHIQAYSEHRKQLAMRVLMWITYCQRPLRVTELQHALATRPGRSRIHDYMTPASTITSVCAGLVVIENDYVGFVHFTAKEYLSNTRLKDEYFSDAHREITTTCLDYLSLPFSQGLPEHLSHWVVTYRNDSSTWTFYDYAALNWGSHAQKCDCPFLDERILLFLTSGDTTAQACFCYISCPLLWDADSLENSAVGPGIFLAIYHRQTSALRHLLEEISYLPFTVKGRSPLALAAQIGDVEAIQAILDWWAKKEKPPQIAETSTAAAAASTSFGLASIPDHEGVTPLSNAAAYGHALVVRLLLQLGDIDVDSQDTQGRTPFMRAAETGHAAVMRLMIDHGDIKLDTRYNGGPTPLWYSVHFGYEDIARLLLDHADVDADSRTGHGTTPLLLAAEYGPESIVKMLLEREDVDVNAQDADGDSPLACAAWNGHDTIVKLLLGHPSIHVNVQDGQGRTPLSRAANRTTTPAMRSLRMKESELQSLRVVQLLLARNDVDVNLTDNKGRSPLYYASEAGFTSIAKALQANGAC